MVPGGTTQETTQLNIESLWSGGPFADSVCLRLHSPNSPANWPAVVQRRQQTALRTVCTSPNHAGNSSNHFPKFRWRY
jgi:alpha-L-fucosidase 2